MLKIHTTGSSDADLQSQRPFWLDLLNPTPAEVAQVESEFGIEVPSREALQEIETSSRLRAEGHTIFVSMPLAIQDDSAGFVPVPLGFILSQQLLVTIRFCATDAFSQVEARVDSGRHADSAAVFTALMDGMVDFSADMLERLSSDLSSLSARTFGLHVSSRPGNKEIARDLRESLTAVGGAGDHLSRIRESLLGLQRITGFVLKMAVDWLAPDQQARLSTAREDLTSLIDFEAHLSAKTQFLLDAILGFINTEQNDIFRVLTIVSVVGIPPTLIASMYGMNFHNMPELTWRWGYPYGLTLIALSALLPILWFKRRGWW